MMPFELLKKLDFFPKAADDIRVKTTAGAAISLAAVAVMIVLFMSEMRYFYTVETVDHLYVSSMRSSKGLKVDFDLTFPEVSCGLLSIDVLDEVGAPQADAVHNVYKFRITPTGQRMEDTVVRVAVGETLKSEKELIEGIKGPEDAVLPAASKCGDCYGAGDHGQCCNSCEDVREAYERKGWRFRPQGKAQCDRETQLRSLHEQFAEDGGCQIFGQLELSRASGHFHIAPHKSLHLGKVHAAQGEEKGMDRGVLDILELISFAFDQFNITHTVNSLSFGDQFPGIRSPLDGQYRRVEDTHGMYQYYIKVVPTSYRFLNQQQSVVESNAYSVTEHVRHLSPGSGRGLPGVYFYYDVSPVHASFEERRKGLGSFLASVCAIIGGTFAVFGLFDSVIATYLKPMFTRGL